MCPRNRAEEESTWRGYGSRKCARTDGNPWDPSRVGPLFFYIFLGNRIQSISCMKTESERFLAMRWLAMVGALLAFLPDASATLRVWSGNAPMASTWTDAQNWAGGIAPVAGDDLEFPFDAFHPNAADDYTNGTTFNSILFWHGGSGSAKNYNLGGNS